MENTPPPRPPHNCRIEPGLEADPVVIRLAALSESWLSRGLAHVVTGARLVLPPYPVVPAAPWQGPAADADAETRAAHGGASLAELDELAGHESDWVRMSVASNLKTPAATLMRLVGDPSGMVRMTVANHPNLPLDGQTRLADRRLGNPGSLAGNPNLSPALASHLSKAKEVEVRERLARNRCVPPALLARLAEDPDRLVRAAAAENPSTPEAALARLALDGDERVREAVKGNRPAVRADFEPWPDGTAPELTAFSLFEGGIDAYVDEAASTVYFVRDRLETVEQAVALFQWVKFGQGEV